jgi:hypothetical protein
VIVGPDGHDLFPTNDDGGPFVDLAPAGASTRVAEQMARTSCALAIPAHSAQRAMQNTVGRMLPPCAEKCE